MILRPKPSLHRHTALPGTDASVSTVPVPAWLRRAVQEPQSLEDAAIACGGAIGALDSVVRREERWAGAWRQRLALAAAAVTVRQAGRVEDEAALRDAVLLSRPGDFLSVGPAGSMLLAWRRLAARSAEELLTETSLAAVLEEFGYAAKDEMASDLAGDLRQVAATEGPVGILTGAYAAVEQLALPRAVGSWIADALLAQRLGWQHAVPLLGGETVGAKKSGRARFLAGTPPTPASGRVTLLLGAQARAALRAIDLGVELGRRADRLLAVAPKLRAKASGAVVERLLSDDAMTASENIAGMSDRGLRRLFDRLVELGAVRELSGRAAFRIYGL